MEIPPREELVAALTFYLRYRLDRYFRLGSLLLANVSVPIRSRWQERTQSARTAAKPALGLAELIADRLVGGLVAPFLGPADMPLLAEYDAGADSAALTTFMIVLERRRADVVIASLLEEMDDRRFWLTAAEKIKSTAAAHGHDLAAMPDRREVFDAAAAAAYGTAESLAADIMRDFTVTVALSQDHGFWDALLGEPRNPLVQGLRWLGTKAAASRHVVEPRRRQAALFAAAEAARVFRS